MRNYLFLIFCISTFSTIVGIDYFNNWPPAEKSDFLTLVSIFTIYFTANYALSNKQRTVYIYYNYKNLVVVPVVPKLCFRRELFAYFKTLQNLIFILIMYLFFLYFISNRGAPFIILNSLSLFLYYIYFSYILIILRFYCTHTPKGRSTFLTICMLINAVTMYQIVLVSAKSTLLLNNLISEYNPLNSLFFLTLTNDKSILYLILPYTLLTMLLILIVNNTSWENRLNIT